MPSPCKPDERIRQTVQTKSRLADFTLSAIILLNFLDFLRGFLYGAPQIQAGRLGEPRE